MASERRFVTVLFADVSGYTRLSEGMDPEDVQELMDDLFRRLRVAIEAQGGTIDKFIGDAVMAVFGAPAAHEDDPLRAVRAALAVQQAVAAFSRERAVELRLRVGLNAGEVLWGSVGGDRATATGDAVNVAQRLESAAEPGAVFASKSVERATAARVRFKSRGAIQVKNREETVEAFEALGEFGGMTEYRLAGAPTTPFVGRSADLERLEAALNSGRAAFLVIEGEAGVGKSRLLAEFRRRLRDREDAPEVHVGRAVEGVRLPLAPFADILRTAARIPAGAADAPDRLVEWLSATAGENAASVIALSAGLAPPDSPVRFLDPARAAAEAPRAWARWLASRAADRPVVVCLEDLHWADENTLALAEELPPLLAGARVLVVATARPGAKLPAGFERHAVEDLTAVEAAALARDVLRRRASPELAAFLAAQAGGHPLYVEELVRFLDESSLLEGEPARLAAPPDRIPRGLQGLLTARLDALPDDQKSVLKAAAAVGREFWSGIVEALSGEGAARALHEAGRRRIVSPQPGSLIPGETEYAFRHALIREAAYALLPKRDRAKFHEKAADELEKRAPAAGRRALSLAAAQREAAGQPAASAALWERASRAAREAFAWEEAMVAVREALRLGAGPAARLAEAELFLLGSKATEAVDASARLRADGSLPPAVRDAAGLCQATALLRLGEHGRALEVADAHLVGGLSPSHRLALLSRRVAALSRLGRFDECFKAIAETEAFPAGEVDAAVRSEVAGIIPAARVIVLSARGELGGAIAAAREAVAQVRVSGNLPMLAVSHGNLGLALLKSGRHAEAKAEFQESNSVSEKIGDRWGCSTAQQSLILLATQVNDHAGAVEQGEKTLALCRELRNRSGEAVCLAAMAGSLLDLGRRDEGERWYRESWDIRKSLGDVVGEVVAIIGLARARRFAGDLDGARELANQGLHVARERGRVDFQLSALVELACVAYEEGRHEEVEEHTNAVRSLMVPDQRRGEGTLSRFLRGLSMVERGDRRALQELEETSRDIPLESGGAGVLVGSLRARALASFGHAAEAAAALSAIAEKMPGADGLPGMAARLEAGRAALVLGDRALASRFAEEASRELPGCADAGLRGRVEALVREVSADR